MRFCGARTARRHGLPRLTERTIDTPRRLEAARVVLDSAERRRRILEGAERLARAEGLRLVEDPELVEEIAGLELFAWYPGG